MRPARLVAIALIYLCTALAWFTLGASVVSRTGESDAQLAAEVTKLWGGRHRQIAPDAWYEQERTEQVAEKDPEGRAYLVSRTVTDRIPVALRSSRITVRLDLDQRRKGLLWYDTYGVAFAARYRIRNPDAQERVVFVHFPFPSAEALYDDFRFRLEGTEVPAATNPGPLAARITFFAPVSLLFFLTVMVILGALRGESLHPMNYFFVAAAFFSFHLLLAYLVDHLDIHASFLIAAATSVFLVVSYLRLVGGLRFALAQAGVAQVVFLVLFSYAFFFEGLTGLTVTVGAVLTLFALMQLTGRVDWNEVFRAGATRAS